MSSSQTQTTQKADLDAVVEALRSHDRFLVTTHENPDGDALGSLLAMTLGLRQLGKDVDMYLAGETPLPPDQWEALHSLIKPQANESKWARIPWLTNLDEARKRAVAEDKPIFLWRAGGGDVLGRA